MLDYLELDNLAVHDGSDDDGELLVATPLAMR